MISDDVYQTIATGYRKKCRQEARKAALSVAMMFTFVMLCTAGLIVMGVCARSQKVGWENAVRDMYLLGGGAFLIWSFLAGLIIRGQCREIKERERERLKSLKEHPEESHHAELLFEFGFYELALKGYDDNLAKLFEEAPKREEELARFFEEFWAKPRFVDGFPRPIPFFQIHNLDMFDYYIGGRVQCLAKLGREEEAEAEIARRLLIRKIKDEGRELTEKYWDNNDLD